MSKFLDTAGLGALRDWVLQKLGLKQDTLVSGTNIKTINNQSLLGNGDITISGGSGLQNLVDGSATGSVRGIGTTAEDSSYTIGTYAVAEGSNTKASGNTSHAEGDGTKASGDYAHAEGAVTIASGEKSHAEGSITTASGTSSHAEGMKAKASGKSSHAEGWYTIASGDYSHAGGQYTIAACLSQTAIGKYNIKDTETVEANQKAFIIGNGTFTDDRSNALTVDWQGNVDIASGAKYKINGTALSASDVDAQPTLVSGTNIKTINNQSILGSGDLSISGGLQNFVDGSKTGSVRGIHAAVEDSSYTMKDDAFAQGRNTKASGFYSHAEGLGTTARGDNSHAEGLETIAGGSSAHAEGSGTKTIGDYSHAEGYKTEANGSGSHAEGWGTETIGLCSHAEGKGTIAAIDYQTVIGKYNVADLLTQNAFIVGGGTGDDDRVNAFTVDWDGNIEAAGTVSDSQGDLRNLQTGYLKSPNGKKWALKVDNNGNLSATVIS